MTTVPNNKPGSFVFEQPKRVLRQRAREKIDPGAAGGLALAAPHIQRGVEMLPGDVDRAGFRSQQTAQHLDIGLLTEEGGRPSQRLELVELLIRHASQP